MAVDFWLSFTYAAAGLGSSSTESLTQEADLLTGCMISAQAFDSFTEADLTVVYIWREI